MPSVSSELMLQRAYMACIIRKELSKKKRKRKKLSFFFIFFILEGVKGNNSVGLDWRAGPTRLDVRQQIQGGHEEGTGRNTGGKME